MLQIRNLHVFSAEKEILRGVNLSVKEGEVHIILGPNGSGKSTLGKVLLGSPEYRIVQGSISFEGEDLLSLKTFERARRGIFLSHQSPPEVSGVSLKDFLRSAEKSLTKEGEKRKNVITFQKDLKKTLAGLHLSEEFLFRSVHEDASGGEKKKIEMASLFTLNPKLLFLDEFDSGVDIDALQILIEKLKEFLSKDKKSAIIVTHSEKILKAFPHAAIHIFGEGKILKSGKEELGKNILQEGFIISSS